MRTIDYNNTIPTMTSDSGGDVSGGSSRNINNGHDIIFMDSTNNGNYSNDSSDKIFSISTNSNENSNKNIKSQIISKLHGTTSFLSGIVAERKKRNEYEDLDKIHSYKTHSPTLKRIQTENSNYYKSWMNREYYQGYGHKNSTVPDFFINDLNKSSIRNDLSHCTSFFDVNDNKSSSSNESLDNVILQENSSSSMNKQNYKKSNLFLVCYILFYTVFLLSGGLLFHHFEEPVELEARNSFQNIKIEFIKKYPQITDDDLESFLAEVVKANDRGISPLRNSSSESNWGFGQALFFSSTVVTTIGYGHVTPLSQTGKIFCMIYATVGIPLTLILLTAVVERLLIPANWLLGSLNTKLGHLYQPFNIRLLHLFIIATIVGILFFAIPTVIFAYLEPSWNLLDAFYYCFISMTTIGLGDYIPGEGVSFDNRSLYKICITFYLITGLIAMMLALTIFYEIPQLNLGQLFTENSTGENEKLRLSGGSAPCYSGPAGLYIPQRDEDMRRAVVRIRPHGDESPSPDEQQPPSLHRDMRVP